MTMSNTLAVCFALTPGAAESIEKQANNAGNMAWLGMAKAVKYARNALYIGIALTAIASIGAILAAASSLLQYSCAVVAILGLGLIILSAKRLYNATVFFQSVVNSGARP